MRKLSRREAPAGGLLSTERAWTEHQLNLAGIGLFFALCLGAAVVHQLTCAPASVLVGGALAVLVALGAVALRKPKERPEPPDVELTLAAEEVHARLGSGALSPDDLVHEGNQWRTLLESAQFGESAEGPHAARVRRQRLVTLGLVTLAVVLVLGAGVAFAGAENPLGWLLKDDC